MIELCLFVLEDDQEKEAFENIYYRCRDLLYHVAMGFFLEPHRSEEAVQDVFLAVAQNFKKISSLNAQEQDAYLVVIVKNKCRDILRREKKYAPEEAASVPTLSDDSVHMAVEKRVVVERVAYLINKMPEQYKEVLERRLLLNQSNGQIARLMGVSESVASRRFEKGRTMLIELLMKEGISHV